MYPAAKTGDWGLATKIKHGDFLNPVYLRGAGTEPYLSPVSAIESTLEKLLIPVKGAKTPHVGGDPHGTIEWALGRNSSIARAICANQCLGHWRNNV